MVYLPYVITACVILHNTLCTQEDEDLHAMATLVDNEGLDGDSNGALKAEVDDACDDSLSHRINRIQGDGLRRSLANYLRYQREVIIRWKWLIRCGNFKKQFHEVEHYFAQYT